MNMPSEDMLNDRLRSHYMYAAGRGVELGRDMVADALSHPIDTARDTLTAVWDGFNVMADATFGVSTQGSRERSLARGRAVNDTIDVFKRADGVK